jgi:hypothetical protein
MGQSATLYRISKSDFSKVENNPDDFGLFKINKSSETFEKTFEGLRFVLSKGQTQDSIELIKQTFYPKSTIGEQIDYSTLDFDNLPEGLDLLKEPVFFNDPTTIIAIASVLDKISIDDFKNNFNPDELNEQNIYPGGVWNRHTEPDFAFNERDMLEEFLRLKTFYHNARQDEDYVLSYVG